LRQEQIWALEEISGRDGNQHKVLESIPNTRAVADLELGNFWSDTNDVANNLMARDDRLQFDSINMRQMDKQKSTHEYRLAPAASNGMDLIYAHEFNTGKVNKPTMSLHRIRRHRNTRF
jgi:hypothetical protein